MEVCWNNFKTGGTALTIVNSDTYAGQHYNTFIYRNTVQANQIVCRNVGASNYLTDANIFNATSYLNWNEAIQTSTVPNIKTTTDIDSSGNLTGATGFGTHGWRFY